MRNRFNILGSLFLVIIMLQPLVVKGLHTFDDHQHSVCSNFDVHIHKKELECGIDQFHFSLFNFSPVADIPEQKETVFGQVLDLYHYFHFDPQISHQSLRGPPGLFLTTN